MANLVLWTKFTSLSVPYEFVLSLYWLIQRLKDKDIRRKDGTPYVNDCRFFAHVLPSSLKRRTIQIHLRSRPGHKISFFKKDQKQKGFWRLCHTIEEALETEVRKFLGDANASRSQSPKPNPRRRCCNNLFFLLHLPLKVWKGRMLPSTFLDRERGLKRGP